MKIKKKIRNFCINFSLSNSYSSAKIKVERQNNFIPQLIPDLSVCVIMYIECLLKKIIYSLKVIHINI